MERLEQFRKLMVEQEIDGFLATTPENRRYLSGFTGSSGVLLIDEQQAILLTDFRYLEQAADQIRTSGFSVKKHEPKLWPTVIEEIKAWSKKPTWKWGFESEHLVEKDFRFLRENLSSVELVPTEGLINLLRRKKSAEEIDFIKKAVAITDQAWEKVKTEIKPGRKETEIAALFEYVQRKMGAEGTSFRTIVASGPRSALPHGVASERKLEEGDLVVLDGGALYAGYCSDFTRTIVVGQASSRQRELYNLVLEAQETALTEMRPGMTGKEVDALAREVITKAGYGEYFGHGLGHSLGLAIHESPRLSLTDETILEPGVVYTVEPGIYLPGWGGIRIEDVVVVTDSGIENLTTSPKRLTLEE
ncbi:MAG TPA: Xaa-Pro dipeptidase [Firmicutes bacterium]|nr:Xaa-Pro dipeptidase [Bacillota bacterium]